MLGDYGDSIHALTVATSLGRAGVMGAERTIGVVMTGLLWVVGGLGALVVVALGLRLTGAARWAELMRALTSQLEAGRVGAQDGPSLPTRFDAKELVGLPEPVQRYFRAVLTDGQAMIDAASIEMTGSMNMSAAAEQWRPFTSHQQVVTQRSGFLWNAQVNLFPGVPARVVNSYIAGQGQLVAKLLGWFTVAQAHGEGEIARGEFMRYFAEAVWYPTALLPSQGVRWRGVSDSSASATLVDGPISLTLLFRFGDDGLVSSVHAEARGAGMGKDMVMLPWECKVSAYQPQDGMLIPRMGEAAWIRPEGRTQTYFVGQVKKLRYELRH